MGNIVDKCTGSQQDRKEGVRLSEFRLAELKRRSSKNGTWYQAVIINNSRGFIFIHVPKSAGTSISKMLSRHSTVQDIEIGGTYLGEKIQPHVIQRYGIGKHATALQLRSALHPSQWDRFFKFAIVRHPYSRAYSVWTFLRKWESGPFHGFAMSVDFESFVFSSEYRNEIWDLTRPQTELVCDYEGRILMDFIGKVESLEDDVQVIMQRILKRDMVDTSLSVENFSKDANDHREALSESVKARLDEVYDSDFSTFGYSR